MQIESYLLPLALGWIGTLPAALGHDATELHLRREAIVNQPHTFSNEVLFERHGDTIFRSTRFTHESQLFGDFDGDGDVDQYDYFAMHICLEYSGPGFITPSACFAFDFDEDADIDLLDAAAFQNVFSGTLSGVLVEAGELFPIPASPNGYYSGPPGVWGNNALNGIARQAGYSQNDLWYQWSIIQKPLGSGSVYFSNASRPATAFTIMPPLSSGTYVFFLKVTNLITSEFSTDTTNLTATDAPSDSDGDGVLDIFDDCPNTPPDEGVDSFGCSDSQRDSDYDGVTDNLDQCPKTPAKTVVDFYGCPVGGGSVCGNGAVEAGEQCDDGNTLSGDGCSSTCQTEGGTLVNNNCGSPTAISEGTLVYSNVGATTDGPAEPADCTFFNQGDIRSDIWYCYTATCTGPATISLCGSGYDTKMAVYAGCDCPDPAGQAGRDRPLACSDDDCGMGVDNTQSRVTVDVTAGLSYMVRVGGFFGNNEQGEGRLTIRCGQDTCVNGTGSCTEAHQDSQPGCETQSCCERVCEVDAFCCDVTWDTFCAGQGEGFCSTTGFPACNANAGTCSTVQATPGCSDTACCNAVCQIDPYCCITAWDENCTSNSDLICASCGSGRGSCTTAHTTPGCDDVSCCAKVCTADEFCCNSEWDDACVTAAQDLCGQ